MTIPGGWELIVILFIVLLLFGGRKLPGLARSVGESITEFRKGTSERDDDTSTDHDAGAGRDAARDRERDQER